MKILKITLIATLFFASITSCTKQDLTEGDIQVDTTQTDVIPFTGGNGQD